MKKILYLLAVGLSMNFCFENQSVAQFVPDKEGVTNNFYDNEVIKQLPMEALSVEGEIANPGKVEFSKLAVHSVIVKETTLNNDGTNKFVGAYRYDGYSLFDILNLSKLQKKNAEEFNPIIDLYIEISNEKGEKVVFSWGEIYYPVNLHNIIIANTVSLIVPSKTKDLWPLPETSKVIVSTDLFTERNISNPTKITIRSADESFKIQRDMSPMFVESFTIKSEEGKVVVIKDIPQKPNKLTYNTIFYGRGRGIHSTSPFTGYQLKQVLEPYYKLSKENIQRGLFTVAGLDGYRAIITFAELFNRNDQKEFLLLNDPKDKEGGSFRVFPACDFFSDRAIKALSEVRFEKR